MTEPATVRLAYATGAPFTPASIELDIRRVRFAESLGYSAAYTQHGSSDALATAGWLLAATSRIRIGPGIVPIYTRPPAAMAIEAMTFAAASGGRLDLGLGLSSSTAGKRLWGVGMGDPLADMRDYVTVLRPLLDGRVAPASARWGNEPVRGRVRPDPGTWLPLYLAVLGTGMARLAGEIADGLITWMTPVEWVRDYLVPAASEGRARAGLTMKGFDVVAAMPAAATDDVGTARSSVRGYACNYLGADRYRTMLRRCGFGTDVAAYDAASTHEERRAAVSDRFVDAYTALGTAADVRAGVARYAAAGATTVLLVHLDQTPFAATLEAAAGMLTDPAAG